MSDIFVGSCIELLVEKSTEFCVENLSRNEGINKILRLLNIPLKPRIDNFRDLYIHTLVKFGYNKPYELLLLFRDKDFIDAFSQSFIKNDPDIVLREANDITQRLFEEDALGKIEIDPKREIPEFFSVFYNILQENRPPADTQLWWKMNEIMDVIKRIEEEISSVIRIEPENGNNTTELITKYDHQLMEEVERLVDQFNYEYIHFLCNDKTVHFIARKQELTDLTNYYLECKNNRRSRTILVKGEPGTGKTSYICKFIEEGIESPHGKIPVVIGWTSCSEENESKSWDVCIKLLINILASSIKDDIHSISSVVDALISIAPAWAEMIVPRQGGKNADNGYRDEMIITQYKNLLKWISNKTTLIVVIDDFQLIDSSSLELFYSLTLSKIPRPIFLLFSCRTVNKKGATDNAITAGKINMLEKKGDVRKVIIKTGLDVEEYIIGRYGNQIFSRPFIDRIQKLSDGNPLFLRGLFDDWAKYIVRNEETNRCESLPGIEDKLGIPDEMVDLLKQRYDRIKKEGQDILKKASVEGEQFTSNLIGGLSRISHDELIKHLTELQSLHNVIIPEENRDIDIEYNILYRFTHKYYQEYIYNFVLKPFDRLELHAQIALYFENLFNVNNNSIHLDKLILHLSKANRKKSGITYSLLASKMAINDRRWNEAIKYAKNVVSIGNNCDNRQQIINEIGEALFQWETVIYILGVQDEELLKNLLEFCDDIAGKISNDPLFMKLHIAIAELQYLNSDINAQKHAKIALDYLSEIKDTNEEEYRAVLVYVYSLIDINGEYNKAIQEMKKYLTNDWINTNLSRKAYCLATLGWAYMYKGQNIKARTVIMEALRILEKLRDNKDQIDFALVLRYFGLVQYSLGEYAIALNYQNAAVTAYYNIGAQLERYWTNHEIANTYRKMSKYREAKALFKECIKYAKENEDDEFLAWLLVDDSKVEMDLHHYDKCKKQLHKAKEILEDYSRVEDKIDLSLTSAWVEYHLGNIPDAEIMLSETERLNILDKNTQVQYPDIYFLRGKLCQFKGQEQEAVDYFNKSKKIAKNLGMIVEAKEAEDAIAALQNEK